jgi:VanZ family protein
MAAHLPTTIRARWPMWIALAYAAGIAAIVILADTDRLTPLLGFVHGVPLGDKLGHFVLIGALAFVVDLALGARTMRLAGVRLRIGSAAVLAVVVAEEISQRWVPTRSFDFGDLAADVLGIAVGGALAAIAVRRRADSM